MKPLELSRCCGWALPQPRSVCSLLALLITIFIGLLFFSAPGAKADSQGYPSTFGTLTNLPAQLTASGVSGYYTNVIPLRSFSGLGLQTIFQGSNLVTAPVTVVVWPSIDGTNIAGTVPFASLSYPQNGTNIVIGWTNWSNLQLKGITALFLSVSNGSAASLLNLNETLTATNGTAPSGTNFPGGLLFNRPNQ